MVEQGNQSSAAFYCRLLAALSSYLRNFLIDSLTLLREQGIASNVLGNLREPLKTYLLIPLLWRGVGVGYQKLGFLEVDLSPLI